MGQITATQTAMPVAPVAPPRRRAGARLSGGHLLMIVSGVAAFVLVFALFGRGEAQVQVAVATQAIDADAQVTPAMVKAVSLPKDSPLASQLVAYDAISKETRYATVRIDAGTPIARTHLSQARENTKVQTREMALKVDRSLVTGIRLTKGDRIDVISVANDGTACRVANGLRVTAIESAGSGSLGSSSGETTIAVAIERDGDDLRLSTTLGKKSQIVLATGASAVTTNPCVGDIATKSPGK
ncbi:MAG: hypothetical protein ACOYN3_01215 [Acidimicrobiia bacterium]